ncbi:MAG: SDR family oxidoreductase [Candidatus Hadarchaeum sp.]|uniref:SDR family NAD(P)-dependent oxidoreductase n=1 Tax=Candidatus Hadarchaeum sp. TaxID=2883567 RepID=UPI00317B3079
MRLKAKVALITGCASGIGAATAKVLASEGAKIVGGDVNEEQGKAIINEIQTRGGDGIFVRVDVTREDEVRSFVTYAFQNYRKIDIVCNIAGVITLGKVTDLTEEMWDYCMSVNVKGIFLICKYVVPIMSRQGGGVIINVASGAGLIGTRNSAVYCASKAAVIGLTKAMALDHAQDKIRINAICPGVTDTPANARIEAATGDALKARRATEQVIPMGRLASPEEIARCICFLASDESSYMTGSVLVVDGGYTAQ